MSWRRAAFLPLLIFACVSDAEAYYYCSEPTEPSCVSRYGTFDDEWAFKRCRDDVEDFVDDTNAYVRCLAQTSDEAISKANEIIEEFNCRADGRSFC